jgi:serine/threonine protein kinase
MELVEGETLQARLSRGALPPDEVFPIAKQIAEAIEAAHERGILHRDLKPGNIMVTTEGKVKVLDFGLAKAADAKPTDPSLSHSPTMITGPTQTNVLIGTAAYMSPEQLRGHQADARSDIWSFGVVLYEMFTGKQVFTGETITDLISGIVKVEPDWSALPAGVPTQVVNDQVGRPTYTRDLVQATWMLLASRIRDRESPSAEVIHVANNGTATWFEVARQVFNEAGHPELLRPCTSAEYPTRAARPAYSVLDTSAYERIAGRPLPSWDNAVQRMLSELKAEQAA